MIKNICVLTLITILFIGQKNLYSAEKELFDVLPFPKVGPIMRMLTPTEMTVMGQGDIKPHHIWSHHHNHPNIGAAFLTQLSNDKKRFETFAMLPADYHVGHLTLKNLVPGQKYSLKIGYANPSSKNAQKRLADFSMEDFDWTNAHTMLFETLSTVPPDTFSIIAGSCRRICLEQVFTRSWGKEGDKTFKAMLHNISQAAILDQKTDCLAWFGDQVYPDGAHPVGDAKTENEYVELYEKGFSLPHIRALMSTCGCPTLMMYDDHDAGWNDIDAEKMAQYPEQSAAAFNAYSLFQRPYGKNTQNFWFTASNGVDMFFTDLRKERYPSRGEIMSQGQMDALKAWVLDDVRKDRIKMIISSVAFFLLPDDTDSWAGFNKQRLELMGHLIKNKIKHTMIVTGDAHCANNAMFKALTPDGEATGYEILEVLSSGFYAVAHNKAGRIKGFSDVIVDGNGYRFKTDHLDETLTLNNLFTRISGNHLTKEVIIQDYDKKNDLLRERKYQL
ncbi:MAG: alkaline phosphatase family protein [Alphaproteobacteria bacterium]|nr:alkaline phosphatase family protein [Alphaproteobacteria bacterium]